MSETWNITAKKRLIDLNMSRKELAEATGINYSVVCAVLNGIVVRESVKERICTYLDIKERK